MSAPTAKELLISTARQFAQIDPSAHFGQQNDFAKRLAVMGLIDLLDKNDPMRDVLMTWHKFNVLSFPVGLNADKCDSMETELDDFRAASEAALDDMTEQWNDIKRDLGLLQ